MLRTIKPPSAATLKKYGLTAAEWMYIWEYQGSVCAVCKKSPPTGNVHIDHDHAKNWKKLKPEVRKTHVRGILCANCNWKVIANVNLFKARNIVKYLEDFEERLK